MNDKTIPPKFPTTRDLIPNTETKQTLHLNPGLFLLPLNYAVFTGVNVDTG